MDDTKSIKAGVIGLGVGEKHIDGYRLHPNCEVIHICDFSDEKLNKCKEKYPGIEVTKDASEVLGNSEIDIVSIASYDNYHCEQILMAIQNEKHIFCEKPFVLHEEEAIAVRESLRKKPHLKLCSNLILRKVPRFVRLKEMIKNGVLGDIFFLESDYNGGRLYKVTEGWRGDLDFYSAVYGGTIHVVDLISWLTEEKVVEVFAYGNKFASENTKFKNYDFVINILKFENGLIGKNTVNLGCTFPHFHTLNVYGTSATFVNSPGKGFLITSCDKEDPPKEVLEEYPGAQKGDIIPDFIDSILYDVEPLVSIDDVFDSMSICFAIEKSLNEGKPVKVNYI